MSRSPTSRHRVVVVVVALLLRPVILRARESLLHHLLLWCDPARACTALFGMCEAKEAIVYEAIRMQ